MHEDDAVVRTRQKAEERFKQLYESDPIPTKLRSWVTSYDASDCASRKGAGGSDCESSSYDSTTPSVSPHRKNLDYYGFTKVESFCSPEECLVMIDRMKSLVNDWDETVPIESAFRTDKSQEKTQGSSDYFLDSADRIHFFTEPDVFVQKNEEEKRQLKPGFTKLESLNKVGHGLHIVDHIFKSYSTGEKMCNLLKSLGWRNPVVPQSMYIFKQASIGGEVTSHQDSCFLFTEPRQTCLGLWLALEPATLSNGCVWVRPKSHYEPLRRVMYRNPKYFGCEDYMTDRLKRWREEKEGKKPEPEKPPQMIFGDICEQEDAKSWDGGLPKISNTDRNENNKNNNEAIKNNHEANKNDHEANKNNKSKNLDLNQCDALLNTGFLPAECKAGDLLVFVGTLDHLSLANVSNKSRHTFQLHLVEGPAQGIQWGKGNWLQYKDGKKFLELYTF